VAAIYAWYQQRLKENNALDFDDLLRLTVEILQTWPDALTKWQGEFRHILVDEYQDTNRVQYVLVRLLAGVHQNLFVVGGRQPVHLWLSRSRHPQYFGI